MEERRRRTEQASGQRPRSEYKGSPFLRNYSPTLTGCVRKKKGRGKNERERENEERIDRVKIVIFIVYCRRCVRYSRWPIGDC